MVEMGAYVSEQHMGHVTICYSVGDTLSLDRDDPMMECIALDKLQPIPTRLAVIRRMKTNHPICERLAADKTEPPELRCVALLRLNWDHPILEGLISDVTEIESVRLQAIRGILDRRFLEQVATDRSQSQAIRCWAIGRISNPAVLSGLILDPSESTLVRVRAMDWMTWGSPTCRTVGFDDSVPLEVRSAAIHNIANSTSAHDVLLTLRLIYDTSQCDELRNVALLNAPPQIGIIRDSDISDLLRHSAIIRYLYTDFHLAYYPNLEDI